MFKYKFLIIILLLCTISISIYAEDKSNRPIVEVVISRNFNISENRRIALMPFVKDGEDSYDYLNTDKLSMYLLKIGFTIVERSQLQSIFDEYELSYSGILSKSDLNKLSSIFNIDMLVFGTVKSHLFNINENIRFVNVRTGEVLIMASGSYSGIDKSKILNQEIVSRIYKSLTEK